MFTSISINNPIQSTYIFTAVLLLVLVLSLKRKTDNDLFSPAVTQELKGLAILFIVFSHIGYNLISDHRFLFPLSVAAGVGVNLFLFLSGFGLTMSSLKKQLSIKEFYVKRVSKLYPSLWLVIIIFFLLDYFLIDRTYSLHYIVQSFLGFFPSADSNWDVNSPLWYFTFIVAYYLIFPFIFWRRAPWLSAIIIFFAGYGLWQWNPIFLEYVMRLYKVHILAFPLGIIAGSLIYKIKNGDFINWRDKIISKYPSVKLNIKPYLKNIGRYLLLAILLFIAGYTAYYSNVGGTRLAEELTSNVTMLAIVLFFLLKKLDSRILFLFGVYSFEVYFLHWPIMSRFDIFYGYLPAWLATALYLGLFIGLAYLLQIVKDGISAGLLKLKSVL